MGKEIIIKIDKVLLLTHLKMWAYFFITIIVSISTFYMGYFYHMVRTDNYYYQDWLKTINRSDQVYDRINNENITFYRNEVVINGSYHKAVFSDTDSMLPFLDEGSLGIIMDVDENTSLFVGEIIRYNNGHGNIMHRIVYKGYDSEGLYYITKGDNIKDPDVKFVRPKDVKAVLVGIIW